MQNIYFKQIKDRIVEMEVEYKKETTHLLSEEGKWAIVIAHKYFDLRQADICEKFAFATKGTVNKILKKYQENGNVDNKEKSGRPSIK